MAGQNRSNGNPTPIIDEGWWASLLAEEERHGASTQPAQAAKSKSKIEEPSKPTADWEQAKGLYQHDQIVQLRVTGHNRGGLLVEGENLYGFVPISHLVNLGGTAETTDRAANLEAYVGKTLNLKVIECVPEDGRIVFSERAALTEAGKRPMLFNEIHPGQRVSGQVTNITDFGVFVDLGGVEGLIHISELSWGRVIHPNQIVRLGQTVEVQVIELSPERCRVALSLKRLSPNPWEQANSAFPEGAVVSAVVTSVLSYGAFARLEMGVEGLIHASEMPLQPDQPVKEYLKEGQSIAVRILHVDAAHQRMGLSLRL